MMPTTLHKILAYTACTHSVQTDSTLAINFTATALRIACRHRYTVMYITTKHLNSEQVPICTEKPAITDHTMVNILTILV